MKHPPLKFWSALILAWLTVSPIQAGTVVGTVSGQGAVDTGAAGGGAYASRRYKFVERVDYDRLTDFVVYIDQPVDVTGEPPKHPAAVVQKDAAFDPHVLPVMVGTAVRWPNEDDIYHNVFSMSETKDFNLGLYKDKTDNAPAVLFDRLGRVDVFCGIHSKMHCIILVMPSRFFAVADARGNFRIENIPPGTYRLKAWHERLPARVTEVTVPETGEVKVDFVLSLGEPHND
jgi:plastocyanin|uniref:carboxypeptidase regulatory-like domain-containing protein n=1 Tax=Cephaloticoccus sp. TaxID=1985742 RepID=UPI0040498928